eukprot:scaffold9233_cov102-Cylindrotheca_fusiformis.AAC.1
MFGRTRPEQAGGSERSERGKQGSQKGDISVGEQGEMATGNHAGRKILHEGCSLHMQIAEHSIRAPTADKANPIGVNVGAEKRHSTGRAQRAGGNMLWQEPKAGSQETCGETKFGGKVGGRKSFPSRGGWMPNGVQRRGWQSGMRAKV